MGWGSRPPPARHAGGPPPAGGGVPSQPPHTNQRQGYASSPSGFGWKKAGARIARLRRFLRRSFSGIVCSRSERGMTKDISNMQRIAVLPGDGIGPEVIGQARRVLDWFVEHRALAVAVEEVPYGVEAYRRHGEVLPEATRAAIEHADLVLFGATGGPESDRIPPDKRRAGSLLRIRRSLSLYANLRPIRALPALYQASSLKDRVL